jgi:hypothetical protein
LEGKPLPNQDDDEFLNAASLAAPVKPPRLFETPISWSERIAGISDQQRMATAWYLVRDDRPEGRCYLAGFDEKSKLPVGYMGRQGFGRTMPLVDDWFDLDRRTLGWNNGAVATMNSIQPGGLAINYGPASATVNEKLPPWQLFLIDGDKLLEIDLRKRSLRTILESTGLVAVTTLLEPLHAARADAPDDNNTPPAATEGDETNNDSSDIVRQAAKIALRTTDRIMLLDPRTSAQSQYSLPQSMREKAIQVYSTGSGQLIVQSADDYFKPHLVWLTADGSVAREEHVTLANNQGNTAVAALIGFAVAPIPVGWISGIFLLGPLANLQSRQANTFAEAVVRNVEPTWAALIAVIAIGVLLAAGTYRLQRKYHRAATGIWCAFVFLLGVPGFLAYWFEHRRPKLEACQDCGQIVPRDRDACAACSTPFPAPPLVGTEIFA